MNAPTLDSLQIPPHDIDAEQAVLGSLLVAGRANDSGAWATVSGLIDEMAFYRQDHRLIFRAIESLAAVNEPIDILTLKAWLETRKELENAGGFAYLVRLIQHTPSAANSKAYAEIVQEKAMLRALLEVSTTLQAAVFGKDAASKTILQNSLQSMFTLENKGLQGTKTFLSAKQLFKTVLAQMEQRSASGNAIIGHKSGLNELDTVLSGFEDGKLYLIGARPRVGKTTLAMTIAESFALDGKPVAFFSQEMPSLNLGEKILASQGRVDYSAVRSAQLQEEQWAKVALAIKKMGNVPFYVDDSSNISPADVRSRCRRLMTEKGHKKLGLIVIDYVGLMMPSGGKDHGTENANITAISRELMAIKKEFECPIVLLSQLNRECEKRPNKRPVLSDLRESGSLEQDADAVIFLYRDELYNEESPDKGVAEVIIAKNRSGMQDTVRLAFSGNYQRFDNLAYDRGWD
jgi:replicative DNA helicase